MNSDPYADLSHLCGITAFSLPPRPRHLSASRPSTDLFGPIPDHLLSRYLCYDDPSPQLHSSSPSPSPSATTIHPSSVPFLLDSPSPCPNFTSESLFSCNPCSPASGPRHMDSLLHEREILPPCVVNYQDSLYLTPERDSSASLVVADTDYENWVASLLPPESNEIALCDPNDVSEHLVSVMKDFAFTDGNGKRLLSHIKKLALWQKDAILDHRECEDIVSVMTSFRNFAFSTHARKNTLQEPSRKKRRKHEAKSKLGVGHSDYENWVASLIPSEINEMALCDPNDVLAERLVSVTKDSAFAGKRLPSHIKKLALWHKDVTFMTSFSGFAFSSNGRKNSRQKQRKHEGVASSFHFTRSKSANRLF